MSKFYIQCPSCGANLDPGEKCECRTYKAQKQKMLMVFYNLLRLSRFYEVIFRMLSFCILINLSYYN